jgi:succinoglycan biosynthesis protein ExoM
MHISVCICTFKRPALLKKLLLAVVAQVTEGEFNFSIVVVDNDESESAKAVVSEVAATSTVALEYFVERRQNIALARSKAVLNARGDYIAFIDDDEVPFKNWLLNLLKLCQRQGVDGVLGPVRPYFEEAPPAWVIRGGICERPEHETGYILKWRETRTGNVLFRRDLIKGTEQPFREELGNGGEDQDFFRRMMEKGAKFAWCKEAAVEELVPSERCRRSYLLKRALLRGQNERTLVGVKGISKSILALMIYASVLPFVCIAGHHHFMKYLIRMADHSGKVIGVLGFRPLGNKYLTN